MRLSSSGQLVYIEVRHRGHGSTVFRNRGGFVVTERSEVDT